MARGNIRGDGDDEVAQHRHFHWSLKDIPRFEGHEGEQPFLHLMEFEDYLVASGVSIEPKEVRGNIVQPDYKDIINKFKASLKTMQESGLVCTLRKECQTCIQQMNGR